MTSFFFSFGRGFTMTVENMDDLIGYQKWSQNMSTASGCLAIVSVMTPDSYVLASRSCNCVVSLLYRKGSGALLSIIYTVSGAKLEDQ